MNDREVSGAVLACHDRPWATVGPSLVALGLLLAGTTGCGETNGGLTARIEFGSSNPSTDADLNAPRVGFARRAIESSDLRWSAVPDFVDRLQILALDTDGSTLAETNLYAEPTATQLRLFREGGTWSLDGVPAGDNRRLVGRAFFGPSATPRLDRALVYRGELTGITVVAGRTTDAGVLLLAPGPERVPEADFEGPPPPAQPNTTAIASGGAVSVTWTPPEAQDVAGYLVAISEMSATGPEVEPTRGQRFSLGANLGARFRIAAITDASTNTVIVDGLTDGVPVSIALYAFDDDAQGEPLNYGAPALMFGTPFDSAAPGPIVGLTAQTNGPDNADIEFVAPGEDGPTDTVGRPERYDIRTAAAAAVLTNPASFEALAGVNPPPVAPPGTTVRFSRSFAALGIQPGIERYIGIRAVDAAGNAGSIAVATVTLTSSLAPAITRFRPAVAIAGRDLLIEGRRFGLETGQVTLAGTESSTTVLTLPVAGWTDSEILVQLPNEAGTGLVAVTRADGAVAEHPLTVVAQVPGVLSNDGIPFAFAAAGPRGQVAAVYRERGSPIEGAIERFVNLAPEAMPWAPASLDLRSDQIVAAQSDQRFLFASHNSEGRLDIASVTTSTVVAAAPFRQIASLGTEPPDSLGVALRPSDNDTVPALVVFTLQGTLRTGGVDDARNGAPDVYFPVTSTVVDYDAATVAVAADGTALLAHRTNTGTTARLSLRESASGEPGEFELVNPASGGAPQAGPKIIVRSQPGTTGPFIIAYEHVDLDGTVRIRLLTADRFGATVGIAPFDEEGLQLQDIGWVFRASELYLAVAAIRAGVSSTELHYTELPYSAMSGPDTEGLWPGAILDVGPADTRARVGCAFEIMSVCPIAWMGDSTGIVFLRR